MNNLDKVLKIFGLMWVLTAVGLCVGPFVPPTIVIALAISTIVLVIAMCLFRQSKTAGLTLGFLVSFFLGITSYSAANFYVGELGIQVVLAVFITCVIVFACLGTFGYKLSKDLKGMGMILFILLLALVIFSIVAIFINFSNIVMAIVSGIGVLIFIGYTVYDFNQLSKQPIHDEDVPILALNLYLDLLNLILSALRLVYYLKELTED